jgi:diguanylate cyclase (GGDEF)-like protein
VHRANLVSRLASFGLGIVFVALTSLALWGTTATQRAANHAKTAVLLSDLYATAAGSIETEALLERSYRLEPSADVLADQQAAATATVVALDHIRADGEPDDRRAVTTALAAHAAYLDSTTVMFAAVDAGDPGLVKMLDQRSVEPPFKTIVQSVNRRRDRLHARAIESLAELARTQQMVSRTTLVALTMGVFFLCTFVLILRTYQRRIADGLNAEIARLSHAALTDSLTKLGNHRAYQEAVQRSIDQALDDGEQLTLAVIDVDEFKIINDRNGHSHGDRVLSMLGKLLGQLRADDRVLAFRIGGDEFALILPCVSLADAVSIMHRFQATCALEKLSATLSIGLSALTPRSSQAAILQEQADAALYEAKRRGRNVVATFDEGEERGFVLSSTKNIALRTLLEEGHVSIVFQPIWDLARNTVLGYEALTRLPPAYGFSGPQEAFDLAERTGHAHELDALCRAAILARASEIPDPTLLFLNISPQTLDHEILAGDALVRAVARAGLKPDRVVLEVTERSMARPTVVIREAKRLQALGFRLALDDTGAGNAGLEMLSRLPVDFLKIDGELVAKAVTDRPSRSVLAGIIAIARENGAYVIAEGIEDAATLELVKDAALHDSGARGIHGAQGYFLGRPSPDIAIALPLSSHEHSIQLHS